MAKDFSILSQLHRFKNKVPYRMYNFMGYKKLIYSQISPSITSCIYDIATRIIHVR